MFAGVLQNGFNGLVLNATAWAHSGEPALVSTGWLSFFWCSGHAMVCKKNSKKI